MLSTPEMRISPVPDSALSIAVFWEGDIADATDIELRREARARARDDGATIYGHDHQHQTFLHGRALDAVAWERALRAERDRQRAGRDWLPGVWITEPVPEFGAVVSCSRGAIRVDLELPVPVVSDHVGSQFADAVALVLLRHDGTRVHAAASWRALGASPTTGAASATPYHAALDGCSWSVEIAAARRALDQAGADARLERLGEVLVRALRPGTRVLAALRGAP